MDAAGFISDCLAQVNLRLLATCEGLSPEQLLWRPAPTVNNIGFILWHLSCNEDTRVTTTGNLESDIWTTDSWHERFGQPASAPDPGDRMGLRALAIPSLEVLKGYAEAVQQRTARYLSGMTPEGLDQAPRRGPSRAHRWRLSSPPDHPQEQPPRPDRLPAWPPGREMGPAPQHRGGAALTCLEHGRCVLFTPIGPLLARNTPKSRRCAAEAPEDQ